MRYLFYCDTPFQVLNALNMHFHRVLYTGDAAVHADIMIVEQFRDAPVLAASVKSESLFERVIVLKKEDRKGQKNGFRKAAGIAIDAVFPERLLNQQLTDVAISELRRAYDVIVASVLTHTVSSLRTLNPESDFVMMDDGMGSYLGDIIRNSRSQYYLKLLSLKNKGKDMAAPSALYVNSPEICSSNVTDNVLPLPRFSEEFLALAYRVFQIPADIPRYDQPIIWLTQATTNEKYQAGAKQIAEILSPYSDKVIVRLHPRETDNTLYRSFTLDRKGLMWELQLSRITLEDKLLVSFSSTAQLSPKLLYGEEPWLLFAYKLLSLEENEKSRALRMIIERIRDNYNHSERVCVPETWEEFEVFIQKYLENR